MKLEPAKRVAVREFQEWKLNGTYFSKLKNIQDASDNFQETLKSGWDDISVHTDLWAICVASEIMPDWWLDTQENTVPIGTLSLKKEEKLELEKFVIIHANEIIEALASLTE